MSKATIAGLIEFISQQPPERPTTHISWSTCAVGDYVRSIGEGTFEYQVERVVDNLWKQVGTNSSWTSMMRVGTSLLPTPSIMDTLASGKLPNSYGELLNVLRDAHGDLFK